jgi:hypothetical protein
MTLLEIAEHLAATQQTLYNQEGMCVLRLIGEYENSQRSITDIHEWKGAEKDSFYITKPDDGVTFILLVHECISNI